MTYAILVAALCMQSGNLVDNGTFSETLERWITTGDASLSADGYGNTTGLKLVPAPGITAEALQRIEGLQRRTQSKDPVKSTDPVGGPG